MSFLTSISGLVGTGGKPPAVSPPPDPSGIADRSRASAAPPSVPAAGGGVTGDMSRTVARIPPVLASRALSDASAARPGGDGQAEAVGPDRDATRLKEEAALRDLLQKELLSRLPVPIQAIPKLSGDLEQLRSISDDATPAVLQQVGANDPTRPSDPAA